MNHPIPATVPQKSKAIYKKNYDTITNHTDRLFLFAADQKIEHLNDDFYGHNLTEEINNPEHIFSIASISSIGAFATHLGLISRYGPLYKTINYIVKLNGKTNLTDGDPISSELWTVKDAIQMGKNADLNICGVGYTIYPGSDHEHIMLAQAAAIVQEAHENGLLAFLWIYPRGHSVHNAYDPHLIAGAAGLGASLGADFIKIHAPQTASSTLQEAVAAAHFSHVLVSGGAVIDPALFISEAYSYIHEGNVSGIAVGRNIFQHDKKTAIIIANALSEIVYKNLSLAAALALLTDNS